MSSSHRAKAVDSGFSMRSITSTSQATPYMDARGVERKLCPGILQSARLDFLGENDVLHYLETSNFFDTAFNFHVSPTLAQC